MTFPTPSSPPSPAGPNDVDVVWPIEPLGETSQNTRSTPDGRLIETRPKTTHPTGNTTVSSDELVRAFIASKPTHPTRTVVAKVTCILCLDDDDDGFEITVADTAPTTLYYEKSWRFTVADAAPYPVGSTILLEVPA